MFKPLKHLAVATAVVAAFSANAVRAETQNAGVIGTAPTVNTFLKASTGGFFDSLEFTLGSASILSTSAKSLPLTIGSTTVLNISELGLTLWDGAVGSGTQILGSMVGNGSTTTFSLAAGTYHFNISGAATGTNGGVYSVGMSAAPVPEPETYAMLLAGLGMLGFMARRRMAN